MAIFIIIIINESGSSTSIDRLWVGDKSSLWRHIVKWLPLPQYFTYWLFANRLFWSWFCSIRPLVPVLNLSHGSRYWIKYRKIRLSPSLCIQSYCHLHNNALADECRILGVYQIKGILKVCVDTWPPKGDKSHWNIDKLLLRCWWLFFFSAWQRRRYGVCHLLRHGRLMMMGVGSERGAETMSVCLPGEATRKWEFARAENYISPSRHRYVNRTTNFPFANLNSHTFGIYPSDGRMPQLMSSYLR